MIQPHIVNRDTDFWNNPDDFKPERFFEHYNARAFIPFGAGPRICIGMKFALHQILVSCAKILKVFEISCAPDYQVPYFNASIVAIPKELLVQWKTRA